MAKNSCSSIGFTEGFEPVRPLRKIRTAYNVMSRYIQAMKPTWGADSIQDKPLTTWACLSTWKEVMGDGPSTGPTKLPSSMAIQRGGALMVGRRWLLLVRHAMTFQCTNIVLTHRLMQQLNQILLKSICA